MPSRCTNASSSEPAAVGRVRDVAPDLCHAVPPARRHPRWLAGVEVADETELAQRRRGDHPPDRADRIRLAQPRARVQAHRRASVGDHDHARRSSAKCSRTRNSGSRACDESRAEDFQSIAARLSPGRYGREPATLEPSPRREARRRPNGEPAGRHRGTSGKVSSLETAPRGRGRAGAAARARGSGR